MIMRRLNRLWMIACLIGLLFSCEQELQISADGKPVPVIYAIINPEDTLHSIRISHSFKGTANATVSAQNPDSICYGTLTPKIEFYSESGWKYQELKFLPNQNSVREEGYFSNQGLQLYQCKAEISSLFIKGTHLVLNIPVGTEQHLVSATVEYLEPPKILTPVQGIMTLLEFYPLPFDIEFLDLPGFPRYETHLLFHYKNVMKNGDTVLQTVDKSFIRSTQYGHLAVVSLPIRIRIFGDFFLGVIKQDIKYDPDVDFRLAGQLEVILYTGSSEYYNYIDLNENTDDYGGKVVTNITGGVGVFALKYQRRVTNIFLGPHTMDSLMFGSITRQLNFKNW
jgi:hypothetical protein